MRDRTLCPQAGFAAIMVNGLCSACFDPLAGWLSDKIGRKAVVIVGMALFAASTYPAFLAIVHFGTPVASCPASGALGILNGISQPPALTAITELLPRAVRAGTLAVVYALAISVFGGSTQFIITGLIGATGNPLAPAWYMLAATAVGLGVIARLPESAPRRDTVSMRLPAQQSGAA
jgi:MFS family permease